MSSTANHLDKPLELIQKTYSLQTTASNHDNGPPSRSSIGKVSTHQPSRKSSVHDIHEVSRDDLNKILVDIHANLSRMKMLLEMMQSVPSTREEFFKLKDQLFVKVFESISKLPTDSSRRGSVSSRVVPSNPLVAHPHHLISCMDHFRSELCKAKQLFTSLIVSAAIGTATLESIENHRISNFSFNEHIEEETQDVIQIKKDISKLEEHAYILSQRYYSHITDEGMEKKAVDFNVPGLGKVQLQAKMSTTSSIASFDQSSFCARLYQKCQMICCFCTPNYI